MSSDAGLRLVADGAGVYRSTDDQSREGDREEPKEKKCVRRQNRCVLVFHFFPFVVE